MLYFAYGMNMPRKTMSDLVGRHISAVGAAVLPDFKLVFRTFADVEEAPGERVLGVAWTVNGYGLHMLDSREGYPFLYDRILRPIIVEGVETHAWVYRMQAEWHEIYNLKPDSYYLGLMKAGRQEFGHPIDDLELVMP